MAIKKNTARPETLSAQHNLICYAGFPSPLNLALARHLNVSDAGESDKASRQ